MNDTQVFTLQQIARLLGETPERIARIVRQKKIESRIRVGPTRLFDEEAVKMLREFAGENNHE